jgi:hypothetical protein
MKVYDMEEEGKIHVCLVCHTEPDVWDGGFSSIDIILPEFLRILGGIHDSKGITPRVAWCLTSQVAQQRPEPFLEMLSLGHEIGVHSHFPGASGILEHQQESNQANLDKFSTWFPGLCSLIIDAGFPPPRTHVTWMFAYRDSMTRVLADAGIRVDCSVCYGGAHYLTDGFLLADSTSRSNRNPYRLAEEDHCKDGDSPVIEIPISGGFGTYWEPAGEGGFRYFSPVASDAEMNHQMQLFQKRLDVLLLYEVDIFQIHFHLYEFLTPGGIEEERLKRAGLLLDLMARDNRGCFSTPSKAASNWSSSDA